jgi:antitoxin component YwqK of YwqJK toxin-antitoxin module
MDGWGKLYYEGGKLAYEGNWSEDEFHGFGKVYNDNPVFL